MSLVVSLSYGKGNCIKESRLGMHIWRKIFHHLEDMGSWSTWTEGSRPDVQVTIRWVPAHLPKAAVERCDILPIDYEGNKAADLAAKAAAAGVRVAETLTKPLKQLHGLAVEAIRYVAKQFHARTKYGAWPDAKS